MIGLIQYCWIQWRLKRAIRTYWKAKRARRYRFERANPCVTKGAMFCSHEGTCAAMDAMYPAPGNTIDERKAGFWRAVEQSQVAIAHDLMAQEMKRRHLSRTTGSNNVMLGHEPENT